VPYLAIAAAPEIPCAHPELERIPPKGEQRHYPETDFEAEKRKLGQEERRIDKLVAKAVRREAAGNLAGAQTALNMALERDQRLVGRRFEVKVAEQTKAREMNVKVVCKICGKVVREFDVVTEDGVVKECKNSARQVDEDQFTAETAVAQNPAIFGLGTVVHLAIPAAERARAVGKFTNKAVIAGNVQEH
jgi:hypothetical protein